MAADAPVLRSGGGDLPPKLAATTDPINGLTNITTTLITIGAVAGAAGVSAHLAQLDMLGVPKFVLTPKGYAWFAFRFFSDSAYLAAHVVILRLLVAVPWLLVSGVFVVLAELLARRASFLSAGQTILTICWEPLRVVEHIKWAMQPLTCSTDWNCKIAVIRLVVSLLLFAFLLYLMVQLYWPLTVFGWQSDANCTNLLETKATFGTSQGERPYAGTWSRLNPKQMTWCVFHRGEAVAGDDADTGGERLALRHGKLVLATVLAWLIYLVLRRWRCMPEPATQVTARVTSALHCSCMVLLGLVVLLLPQHYGALVLPPIMNMVEAPAPAGSHDVQGCSAVDYAYLLSPAPADASQRYLIRFPVEEQGADSFELEMLPAEVRTIRIVGSRDILADPLPIDEQLKRGEAVFLLSHMISPKRRICLLQDAVRLLAGACVITERERMLILAGPDGPVLMDEFCKWSFLCRANREGRLALLRASAAVGATQFRKLLRRTKAARSASLFQGYPTTDGTQDEFSRRWACIVFRRTMALDQGEVDCAAQDMLNAAHELLAASENDSLTRKRSSR